MKNNVNDTDMEWETPESVPIEVEITSSKSDTTTCSSSSSNEIFCRICHDIEGLITPCRCKGSIGYVHESCLLSWLIRSGKVKCELCETAYVLRVKKAAIWTRRLSKHDRAIILVVLACAAFFSSTTVWLLWSFFSPYNAVQRKSDLFVTCYALYGMMDIFCAGVLINEVPHLRLVWKRWQLLKYNLHVLPYPTDEDNNKEATERVDHDASNSNGDKDIKLTRVTVAME